MRGSCPLCESSGISWSFAWGWMMSQLGTCGSGLAGRQMWVTLQCACYRQPEEEDIDKTFFRHMQEAPRLQALVLMVLFNQPNICWRENTAGHKQPRRSLEYTDDNFLTEVIEEPMREMLCWTPYLQTRKNWLGMWRSAVNIRWQSSGSWEEWARQMTEFQPWTSGK